jgi:type II secretory pathway pseudopilin PulG
MHKQNGFTIVELTVTILFLGFVVIGITQLYLSIQRIQDKTAWLQTASRAAQTEIEALRNDNYNSLTDGQVITFTDQLPGSLPAPRSATARISEPQSGLKKADITVSYSDHGVNRDVKVTSLIGVIGISQ